MQKILPICLVGTKAMVSIGRILHNAMNIEAIVIVSANGKCKIFWMKQNKNRGFYSISDKID